MKTTLLCSFCDDAIDIDDTAICKNCVDELHKNIKKLQARITELEKSQVVWHKYPAEKPDSGKECLVLFDEGDYFLDTYNDTFGWMGCLYEYLEHITHWAYLPEAPKEEK